MPTVSVRTDVFLDGNFRVRTFSPKYHHSITLSSDEFSREVTLYFSMEGKYKTSVESVTELINSLLLVRTELEANNDE